MPVDTHFEYSAILEHPGTGVRVRRLAPDRERLEDKINRLEQRGLVLVSVHARQVGPWRTVRRADGES